MKPPHWKDENFLFAEDLIALERFVFQRTALTEFQFLSGIEFIDLDSSLSLEEGSLVVRNVSGISRCGTPIILEGEESLRTDFDESFLETGFSVHIIANSDEADAKYKLFVDAPPETEDSLHLGQWHFSDSKMQILQRPRFRRFSAFKESVEWESTTDIASKIEELWHRAATFEAQSLTTKKLLFASETYQLASRWRDMYFPELYRLCCSCRNLASMDDRLTLPDMGDRLAPMDDGEQMADKISDLLDSGLPVFDDFTEEDAAVDYGRGMVTFRRDIDGQRRVRLQILERAELAIITEGVTHRFAANEFDANLRIVLMIECVGAAATQRWDFSGVQVTSVHVSSF